MAARTSLSLSAASWTALAFLLAARFGVPLGPLAGVTFTVTSAISSALTPSFASAIWWLAVVLCAWHAAADALRQPSRGYGSGENARWNRNIRVDRPVHRHRHVQLEEAWVYTGASLGCVFFAFLVRVVNPLHDFRARPPRARVPPPSQAPALRLPLRCPDQAP